MQGDHAGFVACFADSVHIYGEPELSPDPLIRSRGELQQWLENLARRQSGVSVTLKDMEEHGDDVVAEAIIVASGTIPEAWRLVLAARTRGGLITQVRAFRDRAAARDCSFGSA
jgi:ketosteroid isomerase-like protein